MQEIKHIVSLFPAFVLFLFKNPQTSKIVLISDGYETDENGNYIAESDYTDIPSDNIDSDNSANYDDNYSPDDYSDFSWDDWDWSDDSDSWNWDDTSWDDEDDDWWDRLSSQFSSCSFVTFHYIYGIIFV